MEIIRPIAEQGAQVIVCLLALIAVFAPIITNKRAPDSWHQVARTLGVTLLLFVLYVLVGVTVAVLRGQF